MWLMCRPAPSANSAGGLTGSCMKRRLSSAFHCKPHSGARRGGHVVWWPVRELDVGGTGTQRGPMGDAAVGADVCDFIDEATAHWRTGSSINGNAPPLTMRPTRSLTDCGRNVGISEVSRPVSRMFRDAGNTAATKEWQAAPCPSLMIADTQSLLERVQRLFRNLPQ